MGRFGAWIEQWRDTYRTYPVATVATWIEMLAAVGLVVGAMVILAAGGRVPDTLSVPFVGIGVGFVVWFTVVRQPVFERLVEG